MKFSIDQAIENTYINPNFDISPEIPNKINHLHTAIQLTSSSSYSQQYNDLIFSWENMSAFTKRKVKCSDCFKKMCLEENSKGSESISN